MREKVVVAIDLGTTGNRVIAFSKDGKILAKSYYEFTQLFPQPGWVEHNPMEILETTIKALKEVISQVGADNIVSIGITNQRETTILWDKSGKPVYNAIVWQCRRTEYICKKLKPYQKYIKQKTGLFVDPYFSATKIMWIINNVPGVKEKIKKGEILFGTPETWIVWNLTNGKSHVTEPSNASRTMIFNIQNLQFDSELLKIFKIPSCILPEVRNSDALFGHADPAFTTKEIPIHGILGDQQAALFAQGGWRQGIIKATYGTGIFIMTNTGKKMVDHKTLITTIASKIGNEVYYALEGSLFMGGASMQWLRDNLKIIQKASDSEHIAEKIKDNEGVYFVPAFQGLGAPYWDPDARGLIIGLTRKSTRETIVRAVLESLAYQTRDIIEEIKKNVHQKKITLRVDGGACANNVLMQFQADILQAVVERPNVIETTALGAAAISGIASSFWNKEEFERIRTIDRIFKPRMIKKKADTFYDKWKDAVQRSLGWQ